MTIYVLLLKTVVILEIFDIANSLDWFEREGEKWAAQCDYKGGDIKSHPGRKEDCGKICRATDRCTRFSWTDFNGGMCWLKFGAANGKEAYMNENPTMICGYLTLFYPKHPIEFFGTVFF